MLWIQNARRCRQGNVLEKVELLFSEEGILKIAELLDEEEIARIAAQKGEQVERLDAQGRLLCPGFVDVHAHLRDPGFTQQEDMYSGSRSAVKGGFTQVMAMPNVRPVPDSPEHLRQMQQRAEEVSLIPLHFYSSISKGEKGEELVDFAAQRAAGVFAFTDDGIGLQSTANCRRAMEEIAQLDGLMAQHCEEEALLEGGYIHAGAYCRSKGHRGIRHSVEEVMTARDLILATETGCRYHLCHMSTARSVDLLELAQSWGADVSGEVCPHHLLSTEADLQEDGNWKMNPPLREESDRQRLLRALREGTIRIVATDHAPHLAERKALGLEKAPFGIHGFETAFPLLYTELVKKGELELSLLLRALSEEPAKRFRLPGGRLEEGEPADFLLIDLEKEFVIDRQQLASKSQNTPYHGRKVCGKVEWVFSRGRCLLKEGEFTGERYCSGKG